MVRFLCFWDIGMDLRGSHGNNRGWRRNTVIRKHNDQSLMLHAILTVGETSKCERTTDSHNRQEPGTGS